MTRPYDAILHEQMDYYRARAGEYDRWFFREGRYDRGEQATRAWFQDIGQVQEVLSDVPLDGADVLEFAPGTGLWTKFLCRRARHVTAVDASSEMIDQARRRLGEFANKVQFVEADLFLWEPTTEYDAVSFAFGSATYLGVASISSWTRFVAPSGLPAQCSFSTLAKSPLPQRTITSFPVKTKS